MREGIPYLVVKHYEYVNTVVQSLKEAMDRTDVQELIDHASLAEEGADALRKRIVKGLSTSGLRSFERAPVHQLILHTEDIADQALEACKLLGLSKDMPMDPEIAGDLKKMAVLAGRASGLFYSSLENIWHERTEALDNFDEIREIEHTVDKLEMEVRRKSIGTDCGVWDAILLWRILLAVERVVDRIEDASDEAESIIVARS